MPIADMPGKLSYLQRIASTNFVKILAGGTDFDLASVIDDALHG